MKDLLARGEHALPSLHMERREQSTARAFAFFPVRIPKTKHQEWSTEAAYQESKGQLWDGSVSARLYTGTATSPKFCDLHVCVCRRRMRA